jgi:DNA-binding NtrC family response regulator
VENTILVVDDERDFLESVRRGLTISGFKELRLESDPRQAAAFITQGGRVDIALIDVTMPGLNGMELLEIIKASNPQTDCLIMTAANDAETAIRCLKKGASDYLVKPVSRDELVAAVRNALKRRQTSQCQAMEEKPFPDWLSEPFKPIITRSANVLKVLREAELHGASDVPVLITGESGTGKDLLARAIHESSPRAKMVFTPLNMASFTASLFDAEFFGYTRGAFTGAEKDRAGFLEYTDGGTLFLDEIGNLPIEFQGKLLRVLQEKEYIKLGTNRSQKTNIRFIAATNSDLDRLLEKGMFRKDLYYRLKGAWLCLPPLRERKEDIPLLVDKFLEESSRDRETPFVEKEAMDLLLDYDYPGNIRELKSIVQASVNLAQGKPISVQLLPSHIRKKKPTLNLYHKDTDIPVVPLEEMEKTHILKIYRVSGKNKARAAKCLGIGLNTLRRKLESYGETWG